MSPSPEAASSPDFFDPSWDLSPRRAGWLLTALLLGTALARITLNRYIPGPFIFPDELHYVELARGFFAGHRMLFFGRDIYYPNWLYPIMIAPLIAGWSMPQAHHAILGLNAIVGSLTVLPAYFWARELAGRRWALAGAGLVALLPGLGYSGVVMTECLFLLIMTLTLWLVYRAILRPTFERCLLAGLVAGLGFHVKPQALLLPLIIGGTVLWFEAERLRGGTSGTPKRWTGFLVALARHWVTALGWAVGMTPRLLEVGWMERPGEPLTVQTVVGGYLSTAIGTRPVTAARFALSLAGYLAGWALTTGLWPAWYLAREVRSSLTLRNERPVRLMSQLTTVATLAMLVLAARHTLAGDDSWRLHERYFFVILPPALILFATCATVRARGPGGIVLPLVSLIAVGVAAWQIAYLTRAITLTDSPTFAGFLTVIMPEHFRHTLFIVVFWVVGAFAILTWLCAGGRRTARVTAVGLLLVWLSLGWYLAQHQVNRPLVRGHHSLAHTVANELGRGDNLLVLYDYLSHGAIWRALFSNPGKAVTLDVRKPPVWWTHPIMLAADLRVLSPYSQERTWLLAARQWKFNKEPAQTFGGVALYKLNGEPPLRLDPTQSLPAGIQPIPDLEAARRPALPNLKLTVLEYQLPKAWYVGKSARVRFLLRNDSLFTLPDHLDWRVGYHWRNPRETGSWDAIVWDDNRNVRLPAHVAPGQEFGLHLMVEAPPTPGKWWRLSFQCFERIVDGRHQWSDTESLDVEVPVRPGPRQR
jgi:hypothetical protein